MSELTQRILFGVPAALLFITVMWLGGLYFEITIGLIAALTVWEVHRITTKAFIKGFIPIVWGVFLMIWFADRMPEPAVVIAGAILAVVTLTAFIQREKDNARRWLSTLFSAIYAPVGFLMLVQIRQLGSPMDGFWLTLVLVLMIWGNDIFAYFGGKNFGKTPLAPNISPNKTWEGFWSGFAGALTGLLITYFSAGEFPLPLLVMLPAVIVVSIFGPLGDLTESKLKRLAGVKDSSAILPGHGGFFDRFDALILTSPFIFFYFYLFIG